ncbi:MAG: hypothetical protein Q7S21_07045 [archaeon]|nr:hypothetical protein [archaeon]
MDETEFRILDALTSNLGRDISINELTNEIKSLFGTAFYKNIYDKVKQLEEKGFLKLFPAGNTLLVRLNFDNFLLTDLLSEMELKKKKDFLDRKTNLQTLFLELQEWQGFYLIESILLINPKKNAKLNRLELVFLLRNLPPITKNGESLDATIANTYSGEIDAIFSAIKTLEKLHNIKIDALILKQDEFFELLKQEETNPLKEMLSNKIVFFGAENFWIRIKIALKNGIKIIMLPETNLAKISEKQLFFNLNRFGYTEFGLMTTKEPPMCFESAIASIFLQNNARRLEAIPIILSKNNCNYRLLIFLCKKYDLLGKLLGLLKILNSIKSDKELIEAISWIELIGAVETKFDKKAIVQKLRLYNAH